MSTDVYRDNVLRERWDDATRTYTAWNASGVQASSRPYTAQENAYADAVAAQAQRDSNADTLTAQGIAAIQANIDWVATTLPQVKTAVDAMQAKAAITTGTTNGGWPTRAQTAPTLANLNAVTTHFGNLYDLILQPLVLQVRDLSLTVETLANERKRSAEIETALIRLVLDQLDSTDGTS